MRNTGHSEVTKPRENIVSIQKKWLFQYSGEDKEWMGGEELKGFKYRQLYPGVLLLFLLLKVEFRGVLPLRYISSPFYFFILGDSLDKLLGLTSNLRSSFLSPKTLGL